MSKKEKFLKIKEKAREIEELALRKEQLLNAKGTIDNYSQQHGGRAMHNSTHATIYISSAKDDKNI